MISQQKRQASHPSIKQYFCSKPKQKFLAVSQTESVNTSSSDCTGPFNFVVHKKQHSTVTISKAVSANSQSTASNDKTFQSWMLG